MIKNSIYTNASKLACLVSLLFSIPMFVLVQSERDITYGAVVTGAIYLYLIVANYIMGYRLFDTPKWAHWVVPNVWLNEWRLLSLTCPKDTVEETKKLVRIASGGALVVLVLFYFLNR